MRGKPTLHGWLKKIMVNECLMYLRKKNAFIMVSESGRAGQIAWKDETLDRLSAEDIFQLIVRLPEGYRTVFNLHSIEGWTHREISALQGFRREGTSKSQLSKARSLLQKMLSQNGTDYMSKTKKRVNPFLAEQTGSAGPGSGRRRLGTSCISRLRQKEEKPAGKIISPTSSAGGSLSADYSLRLPVTHPPAVQLRVLGASANPLESETAPHISAATHPAMPEQQATFVHPPGLARQSTVTHQTTC